MMADDALDKMRYIYISQLDAFTLYHISQESGQESVGAGLPALGHALSGAAGTAVSKLITYPLDVVITRLQVQRQLQKDSKHSQYDGILDAFEKIYEREGGVPAFYSGVLQETVKGIADSFLFFFAYSFLRQKRLNARNHGRSLPALDEIGVGVLAGAFSKFFSTPIQQIVTRKQTAAMMKQNSSAYSPPRMSTVDIARQIYEEKGLLGFWSGYSASLVLTLNPSITMLLHKVLLQLLVPRARRSDPGSRVTFLLAAISKALASTVTYPFSLAKTRAQVSSQKPTTTTGETSELKSEKLHESKAARARQRTVFSTIFRIAQTDGLWALYEGLGAEVLKGFFSHGITMLMKDRIHSGIIRLYYLVQKSLPKYPTPEELALSASERAKDVYQSGKDQVNETLAKSVEVAGNATDKVREVATAGSQHVQELVVKGKEQAGELYSRGAQTVGTVATTARDVVQNATQHTGVVVDAGKETASSAYQQTGQLLDKGKNTVTNTTQQAKEAVKQTHITDVDGPDTKGKE